MFYTITANRRSPSRRIHPGRFHENSPAIAIHRAFGSIINPKLSTYASQLSPGTAIIIDVS